MKRVFLIALFTATPFVGQTTCRAEFRVDIADQSEMFLFVNTGSDVDSEYVGALNSTPGVTYKAERFPLELSGRFDANTTSFFVTYQMNALSPINHADPVYNMEGITNVVFDLPQPAKYEIQGSMQGILAADTTSVIFNTLLRDGGNQETLFFESTQLGDEPGVTEIAGTQGVLARGRYRFSANVLGDFGKEDVGFASVGMSFSPTPIGALPEANSVVIWAVALVCLLPLRRFLGGNLPMADKPGAAQ